jgi:GTP-sensing pleiotropic transcriptional regulator CodY
MTLRLPRPATYTQNNSESPEVVSCNMAVTSCTYLCLDFVIHRREENDGNITFKTYQDVEDTFAKKVKQRLNLV